MGRLTTRGKKSKENNLYNYRSIFIFKTSICLFPMGNSFIIPNAEIFLFFRGEDLQLQLRDMPLLSFRILYEA